MVLHRVIVNAVRKVFLPDAAVGEALPHLRGRDRPVVPGNEADVRPVLPAQRFRRLLRIRRRDLFLAPRDQQDSRIADKFRLLPVLEAAQGICADHVVPGDVRVNRVQFREGPGGIGGAGFPQFPVRQAEAFVFTGKGKPCHRLAVIFFRAPSQDRTVVVRAGGHEPDLVRVDGAERRPPQFKVRKMDGIEGPADDGYVFFRLLRHGSSILLCSFDGR